MTVIDSHFHWYPRHHFERLADRSTFPRTERVGDGYRYYFNGGRSFIPLPAVWFDLDAGLEMMDAVTGGTVVVGTSGVLAGLLDQLPPAESVDMAADYNEALAKTERSRPGRFFGTATIPLTDTGAALELLDEAIDGLGLHGVNLPSMSNGQFVDEPRLEPFYARVEELGVPLIIHPTDVVFDEMLAGYDTGLQRSLGRLVDSSVSMLRLILSGVLERHPQLKVMHTHAGGVLPYQAGRIDKNARVEGLPRLPSEYLKTTYVDTVAPQQLTVDTALRFYGADHVMFGTDHPCWSPRAAVDVVDGMGLADEQRQLVLFENAATVLGIRDAIRAAGIADAGSTEGSAGRR